MCHEKIEMNFCHTTAGLTSSWHQQLAKNSTTDKFDDRHHSISICGISQQLNKNAMAVSPIRKQIFDITRKRKCPLIMRYHKGETWCMSPKGIPWSSPWTKVRHTTKQVLLVVMEKVPVRQGNRKHLPQRHAQKYLIQNFIVIVILLWIKTPTFRGKKHVANSHRDDSEAPRCFSHCYSVSEVCFVSPKRSHACCFQRKKHCHW